MKYRHVDPLPSTRDHAHQKPERTGYGYQIGGLCVITACFTWPLMLLAMGEVWR